DVGARLAVGVVGVVVERVGHVEPRRGRHAHDADAVVLVGGDDAGHVRAVTLDVLAAVAAVRRVTAVVAARDGGRDATGEIGVGEVDAGVDDADAHVGAGAGRPRRRSLDLLDVPELREGGIVRRV